MSPKDRRIVFLGAGKRALSCFNRVFKEGFDVVGFVGIADFQCCDEIQSKCDYLKIPYTVSPDYCGWVADKKPDVIVMCWNKIVGQRLLSIPTECTMNLHGGPVPKYRGSSVVNWQIINGETSIGYCILKVESGDEIDGGQILGQSRFGISANDTIDNVVHKMTRLFPDMLVKVLNRDHFSTPPPWSNMGIYWHHRLPEDSRVRWDRMTDVEVHNLVRATTEPYRAFAEQYETFLFPSQIYCIPRPKVSIVESKLMHEEYRGVPGRVVCKKDDGVIVVCQNRGLFVKTDVKLKRGDTLG